MGRAGNYPVTLGFAPPLSGNPPPTLIVIIVHLRLDWDFLLHIICSNREWVNISGSKNHWGDFFFVCFKLMNINKIFFLKGDNFKVSN